MALALTHDPEAMDIELELSSQQQASKHLLAYLDTLKFSELLGGAAEFSDPEKTTKFSDFLKLKIKISTTQKCPRIPHELYIQFTTCKLVEFLGECQGCPKPRYLKLHPLHVRVACVTCINMVQQGRQETWSNWCVVGMLSCL